EAEAALRRSLAILERVSSDFAGEALYRAQRASTLHFLCLHFQNIGQYSVANEFWEQARVSYQGLIADYPTVAFHQLSLAYATRDRGLAIIASGQRAAAEEYFRHTIALQEKLVAQYPRVPSYHLELAEDQNLLAELLWRLGRGQDAEKVYQQGVSFYQTLDASRRDEPVCSFALMASELAWATFLWQTTDRLERAEVAFRNAMAGSLAYAAASHHELDAWADSPAWHGPAHMSPTDISREWGPEQCNRAIAML